MVYHFKKKKKKRLYFSKCISVFNSKFDYQLTKYLLYGSAEAEKNDFIFLVLMERVRSKV